VVRRTLALVALAVSLLAAPAFAVQPDEILADPVLESRARTLSQELRCMVCQNQSIDDSDAPLAKDLRVLVRERLTAGDSDGQVIDFLVARYGEFVLLKPRLSWHTALLWLAPFTVFLLGAWGLIAWRRRGTEGVTEPAQAPLSAAEQARVSELLESSEPR
jgi:cytochrome c-type biogenesis protein CcmH